MQPEPEPSRYHRGQREVILRPTQLLLVLSTVGLCACSSDPPGAVSGDGATRGGGARDGGIGGGGGTDGAPRDGTASEADGPIGPGGCLGPDAAFPPAPEVGLAVTDETRAVLSPSGQSMPPMPLPLLADAMDPPEAGLTQPLHVSVPGPACPRMVHFVSPAIAIPAASSVRAVEARWQDSPLRLMDPRRSEVVEEAHSFGAQLAFWKPIFSLAGLPPGRGALEVRAYDAAHQMVASQRIEGLELAQPPAPIGRCDVDGPHPRIWLTPARLARARARDAARDPAAQRFGDAIDYFLRALDQNPDVLSAAFANAVYDPESYIPALALCAQVARGADDARAARCSASARTLALHVAREYDSGRRSYGRDTGYDIRFGLQQLMLTLDWLFDDLAADERALLVRIGTAWVDWYATMGYARTHPHENYYAGYLQGLTLTAIATGGEGPDGDRLLTLLNQRMFWEMPILNQRLCGGDWPEGWNYGPYSLTELAGVFLALRDHHLDWSPAFDFLFAQPSWLTYQMSPDFKNLISFGGYSGSVPHKTSPALLTILTDAAPPAQAALAARLYRSALATPENDLFDGSRGFTFWEMLFFSEAPSGDVASLPLSYLAPGTGRFVSKSALADPAAYMVTAEAMSYFYDHYGYANGDVRLVRGSACLLCPGAYRGESFAGEATTPAFSTYLVNGMEQRANGRNNQVLFTKEAGSFSAIGMRFESSYASGRYDEDVFDPGNPLDYLVREVVHVRPATLVVRDLHRRRHAADSMVARWHLGASGAPRMSTPGRYQLEMLEVALFGPVISPTFADDTDERGNRIGTVMSQEVPASTAPTELVTVFSESVTAVSYAGGVLRLSSGACVRFAGGTVDVAPCP